MQREKLTCWLEQRLSPSHCANGRDAIRAGIKRWWDKRVAEREFRRVRREGRDSRDDGGHPQLFGLDSGGNGSTGANFEKWRERCCWRVRKQPERTTRGRGMLPLQ